MFLLPAASRDAAVVDQALPLLVVDGVAARPCDRAGGWRESGATEARALENLREILQLTDFRIRSR